MAHLRGLNFPQSPRCENGEERRFQRFYVCLSVLGHVPFSSNKGCYDIICLSIRSISRLNLGPGEGDDDGRQLLARAAMSCVDCVRPILEVKAVTTARVHL